MLICTKCGNENQLGRVFCGTCGSKLDLSNMSSEAVSEAVKTNFFADHWLKFVLGLLVIPIVMIGLAFWPKSGTIGEKGSPNSGRNLGRKVNMLVSREPGKPGYVRFAEKDINGYFEHVKVEKMNGVDSISVKVDEGFFSVHVDKTLFKLPLGGFALEPKLSYDLICVPVGDGVAVRKAKVGHLSASGPLKGMVVNKIHKLLAAQKEWAAFKHLSEIKTEGAFLRITLK